MRIVGKIEPKHQRPRLHERRLKAVAVLPAMATLGNLVCGLGAIYMCMLSFWADGSDLAAKTIDSTRLERFFPTFIAIGCYLVFLSSFFDGIDGRLARLARKTSEFGAQLDSLADIISFGVAPAMLALAVARPVLPVALLDEGPRLWWRVEWVMFAAYVCCTALRLARFNVENEEDESAHQRFKGLPSPGAAAAMVGLVLVHEDIIRVSGMTTASIWLGRTMPFVAVALGLLMVSRVPYLHLVNSLLRRRRSFAQVVVLSFGLLIGAIIKPQLTFAVVAAGYALSGPIAWLVRRIAPRPAGVAAAATAIPPRSQDAV